MGIFGAQWTPTALVINSEGIIASRLAVGDKSIRELIEKVKTEIDRTEPLIISPSNGGEMHNSRLGADLPEFNLPDLSNRNITSKDLLGKKTLVTNWSLTCGYCDQMLDDLRDWDKTKGADEPNLILLSKGEIGFSQKFGFEFSLFCWKGESPFKRFRNGRNTVGSFGQRRRQNRFRKWQSARIRFGH